MRIRLSSRGVTIGPTLRDHTHRRVRFVMSRFEGLIRQVDVRLSVQRDAASASRPECRCRVSVSLGPSPSPVVAEDTQADLYLAIDRAVDRVARTLVRRLERARAMTLSQTQTHARSSRS